MYNEELAQQAESFIEQAKSLNKRGQTAGAIEAYKQAADLFARQEDERGQARAWSGIAKAYGKSKDYERSIEAFGRAADHSARASWPDKQIEALYNQGLTLQQVGVKAADLGQVNAAIEAFSQALPVARQTGDRASEGVLLLSVGFACAWARRNSEASTYLSAAVSFALDGVDFDTAFSALSTLGVLLSNEGRGAEAVPHFERALEMAKSTEGDLVAVADTFANLGVAYEKAGRLEEAIEALDTYREILHVSGDVKATGAAAMVKRVQTKLRLQQKG